MKKCKIAFLPIFFILILCTQKEVVKKEINDINEYVSGLYPLLKDTDMTIDTKIALIKDLTNETLSTPYMLIYLNPNEYDYFVNEFSID